MTLLGAKFNKTMSLLLKDRKGVRQIKKTERHIKYLILLLISVGVTHTVPHTASCFCRSA